MSPSKTHPTPIPPQFQALGKWLAKLPPSAIIAPAPAAKATGLSMGAALKALTFLENKHLLVRLEMRPATGDELRNGERLFTLGAPQWIKPNHPSHRWPKPSKGRRRFRNRAAHLARLAAKKAARKARQEARRG